jgi:quercetin dioxygenase-like cupin family protein
MENEKSSSDYNPVSRAYPLNEMVEYQKGSVVSRTILDKETGTVTIFSFAEGQGLSEHTAPFDAMVYILDGDAQITISGKPFLVGRGEMIIMPARHPHALKAVHPFKMMLVMLKS